MPCTTPSRTLPAFGVSEFESEEVFTKNVEPLVKKAMTEQNSAAYGRDGWLAQQMKAGGLKTREDAEKAVRQFLSGRPGNLNPNHNSPISSTKNPRVLQFFREFFGYHKAQAVFKDVDKFAKQKEFAHFHNHTAAKIDVRHRRPDFAHLGRG